MRFRYFKMLLLTLFESFCCDVLRRTIVILAVHLLLFIVVFQLKALLLGIGHSAHLISKPFGPGECSAIATVQLQLGFALEKLEAEVNLALLMLVALPRCAVLHVSVGWHVLAGVGPGRVDQHVASLLRAAASRVPSWSVRRSHFFAVFAVCN